MSTVRKGASRPLSPGSRKPAKAGLRGGREVTEMGVLERQALGPPCHLLSEFNVDKGKRKSRGQMRECMCSPVLFF